MNDDLVQSAVRAHQAGNLAEAARLYGEVLRANPRHFPAMYAMGFLHYQVGRFEEASRIIGDALRINPRSPEAFFTRGCALQRLNRASEALVCFDSALALNPGFVEAQCNRGMALMALNRDEQALESLDVALALDPSNAGAWNNRGCILEKLGRHEEALPCFEKAIASQPRFAEALINQGSALASLKRFEEAAGDFAKALAIDPERPYAKGNLILFRMHACDWRNFAQDKAEMAAALRAGKRAIYPFVNVALSDSMAEQLQCARILAANDAPASPTPLWRGETYRHDRIRLAYVSADFHAHATAALMAGVFEQHDRSRFETVAISFGKDDKSDMRARVRRAFDRFIDVRERSDAEIASLMRQMEIDIAIDLKGYTQHHRSGIFAHRPAPVQASYLGYPGTMGAPYIDYIIADRIVIPESHLPFYTEQVVYLPDSYQCNDIARPIAEPPTRAERRIAGGRVRLLLLQQQLQDRAGDLRHLDAAVARSPRQRALAARRQCRFHAQFAPRSRCARRRAGPFGVRSPRRRLRSSGAPSPCRSVPRHPTLWGAHDRERCPLGRAAGFDGGGSHFRRARRRKPAACGRNAGARDPIAASL